MSNCNEPRRQFLKYTSAGMAASLFPSFLLANTTQKIKNTPTASFKADVEIEFTAKPDDVQILTQGKKTRVQRYTA
ncbi:MAG: multicopper oxidase family protein, partial [Methylococcales bacterium]|nr:multicopper oxidase family protein [Methylococcales bacterium]